MLTYLTILRTFNFELHFTVRGSEQSVVRSVPTFSPSVELGAALTNDDAASQNCFVAETLHAQAFSFRIATAAGMNRQLFVCHLSDSSNKALMPVILTSVNH